MAALAGLTQQIDRPARHDLASVTDKGLDHLLEIENFGLAINQRDHIHTDNRLQLGLGIEIVEHYVAHFTAPQLDHHTQAVFIGLIAELGDAFQLFLFDELGNALNQARLVQLVGNLVNNDGVLALGLICYDLCLGPHIDSSAPSAVGLNDTGAPVYLRSRREVWAGYELHQLFDADIGVLKRGKAPRYHFAEVMRRNVRRHTHCNPRGSIHQQVRNAGRQDCGNPLCAVIVIDKINSFFVQIGEQGMRNFGHANFCVAHGRRGISVDRPEVTLTIHQRVTQGEILRHAHNRVVNRRVTVGVVFTNHVPDDARRLFVGFVPVVIQLIHGKQYPAVHWL